jgi:hypothetical protein
MPVTFEELAEIPNLVRTFGLDFVTYAAWTLGPDQVENIVLDDFAQQTWNQSLTMIFNARTIPQMPWYTVPVGVQRGVNDIQFYHDWRLTRIPMGWMIGDLSPDTGLQRWGRPEDYSGLRWIFRREDNDVTLTTLDQATALGFDFDDDTMLATVIGRELRQDPLALFVDENDGKRARISVGNQNLHAVLHQNYSVYVNDDEVEKAAVEDVVSQLEEDATMFNRDFLDRFIDQKKLVHEVQKMAREFKESDINDLGPEEVLSRLRSHDLAPEGSEDWEQDVIDDWEPSNALLEELITAEVEEDTYSPMHYLSDMLGADDASKWVFDNVGIDIPAAAEAAVNEDGPGHFLNSYNGNINETDFTLTGVRLPYFRTD